MGRRNHSSKSARSVEEEHNCTHESEAALATSKQFAHLILCGKKKLSEEDIWSIDVAGDLDVYLHSLQCLQDKRVNFIEAAFIVQGCTILYGFKLDYLHRFILEVLQFVSSIYGEPSVGGTQRRSRSPNIAGTENNQIETNERINQTKDKKKRVPKKIKGEVTVPAQSQELLDTTPPVDHVDLNVAFSVEPMEVDLIQPEAGDIASMNVLDAPLDDQPKSVLHGMDCLEADLRSPYAIANLSDVIPFSPVKGDHNSSNASAGASLPEGSVLNSTQSSTGIDHMMREMLRNAAAATAETKSKLKKSQTKAVVSTNEVLFLDPDDPTQTAHLRPLRAGKPYSIPAYLVGEQKKLSKRSKKRKIDVLSEEDEEDPLWRTNPSEPFGDFWTRMFSPNPLSASAGKELIWPCLHDLYNQEQLRRAHIDDSLVESLPTHRYRNADEAADWTYDDDLLNLRDQLPATATMNFGTPPELIDCSIALDSSILNDSEQSAIETGKNTPFTETYFEHRVESMQAFYQKKNAFEATLCKDYNAWRMHIKSLLVKEKERPTFDIQLYESMFLRRLSGLGGIGQWVSFKRLAEDQAEFEVCRELVVSLILANQEQIEIATNGATNNMDLRLAL